MATKVKNSQYTRSLVFFIVFAALFAIIFSFALIVTFLGNMFGDVTRFVATGLFFAATVLAIFDSYFIKDVFYQKRAMVSLVLENSYTLGGETGFYNYEAFKNRADKVRRKRVNSNKSHFIIAFSTTSTATSTFHSNMISTLNYNTSIYLTSLIKDKKTKFNGRNSVFGFNRGIFLVYLCSDNRNDIPELVSMISSKTFQIVDEKKLRIWVQPFFGVKEVDEKDNIVSAIEDALITRNVSEANFETYTFFNPSFKVESSNQDISELEQALENGEFVAFYQPKYSVKEKRFVSAEALARWDSPKYGLLSPSMFIDKAENGGLISILDNYIFEKALQDLSEALRRGRRVLPISVNFSLYEFYSNRFLDNVVALLDKYKVPPSLVEIEITETTSQANQFLSVSVIKKLKDIGIRVLMDDFGVGYSGIENLRNIPFDAIKIDKSFTDLMLTDEKTRSIVKMLTELGHINDIEVIIEGVDSKEQVDLLKKMKVDTIQGFYYAKPMSEKDYSMFLKSNEFEKEKK